MLCIFGTLTSSVLFIWQIIILFFFFILDLIHLLEGSEFIMLYYMIVCLNIVLLYAIMCIVGQYFSNLMAQ